MGVVQGGAEAAEGLVVKPFVLDAVADPIPILPPKVAVVERVVSIQLHQIVRQVTDGWKVQGVDEGVGRGRS